jgi:RNA polymerase sigma-70 factor, ECF subfamily
MQSRFKEKFLLFRIRAKKDPEAFGEVYDMYVARIYRFIYFKVASAEQAEDLTSETFLKAWQYLMERRDVQSLQALLYTVAKSVVIDHYRSSARERMDTGLDSIMETMGDERAERLLKDIETHFDATQVLEKLRGLKDEYREVVVMKYFDDMSAGEIANILGKTSSNVRVILHRATKALQDAVRTDEPRQEAPHNPGHNQE